MSALVANNAIGELLVGIDNVDVNVLLRPGQGRLFPNPIGGVDWFYITVQDSQGNYEIMRCSVRDGDMLTVQRAADGGIALSFEAGSIVELRACAELFNDKVDKDKFEARIEALRVEINQLLTTLTNTLNTNIDTLRTEVKNNFLPLTGGKIKGEVMVTKGVKTSSIESESVKSGVKLAEGTN